MLLAASIDRQPNFPKEDLTDKNAEILSLLLMNREVLYQGHAAAESQVQIYKLGHQAFARAIGQMFDESSKVAALNHGITTYEAISSFVTYPPSAENEAIVILNAAGIVSTRHLDEYAYEAVESLILATPRTAEVVAETTRYPAGSSIAYLAMVGAGMARKFELDNMDTVSG